MPLNLEQYATWLDSRDLPWPVPPAIESPRARPHLARLPKVRAVLWTVYGTLLSTPPAGELIFEHPHDFVQEMALEKTISEFKMWGSMTRKPGQPSHYLRTIYQKLYDDQRLAPGLPGEHHPQILADRLWDGVVKRLLQKDYHWDTGFFGALNEYSKKIAYFFHSSLQATSCYHTTDVALSEIRSSGLFQGLLADGQCFTSVQLQRGLNALGCTERLDMLMPEKFRFLSYAWHGRKPSDRLFRHAVEGLAERNVEPHEILHVGSRIDRDIVPAKKWGMKTALFAGDKASLAATPEQLKDPATRPDLLLTEPGQIAECVG